MTKIAGSGSESISERHRSADPDPHQNVMDPQHRCEEPSLMLWGWGGSSCLLVERLVVAWSLALAHTQGVLVDNDGRLGAVEVLQLHDGCAGPHQQFLVGQA